MGALATALLFVWLSLMAASAEFSAVVWATPLAAALIAAGALADARPATWAGAALLVGALAVSAVRFGPIPAILVYPFLALLVAAVWVDLRGAGRGAATVKRRVEKG